MKHTTYKLTLSDGTKTNIEAGSAGEAVEKALWQHRDRTVRHCYTGMTAKDCEVLRSIDNTARPAVGIIVHDVPAHNPITKDAVQPKRTRVVDETAAMFDEEAIRYESMKAKEAYANK